MANAGNWHSTWASVEVMKAVLSLTTAEDKMDARRAPFVRFFSLLCKSSSIAGSIFLISCWFSKSSFKASPIRHRCHY